MKLFMHYMFLYKAKGKFGWSLIPEKQKNKIMTKIHDRLKNTPYSGQAHATRFSKWTMHWRRNFFYQIYQFFRLNLKIMLMVVRGHS